MNSHDTPSASDISPISVLASWANDQDAWIRLVVKQVFDRRASLDTSAVEECFSHLLAEKGLSDEVGANVEMVATQPRAAYDAPPLVLNAITHTRNINRLIPNQEIRFNPHLTVIYGENASGKTGYVRVLKQVAGARSAEPVLSDIYQMNPARPSATIEFSLGDQQHEFHWTDLTDPHPELDRVIVFDAPATPLHLDDDLTYLYLPSEIALFGYVYDALVEIRTRLTRERDNRHPGGNPFLIRFQNGTQCYQLVESLRASTSLDDLQNLAIIDEAETTETLATLRNELRQLQPADQGERIILESTILRWTKLAMDTIRALQDFDSARYRKALADVRKSEERLGYVSETLFADHNLPGLFSDEWKNFISATDIYARAHIDDDFPASSDSCPYCYQELKHPAKGLLAKYRTYLLDESQSTLNRARADLTSLEATVLALPTFDDVNDADDTVDIVDTDTQEAPDWRRCILSIRALVNRQQQQVRRRVAWNMEIANSDLEKFSTILNDRHTAAKEQLALLTGSDSDRALRIETITAKIKGLEDQLVLGQLLSSITAHFGALKWNDLASTLLTRFQPLLTSLTNSEKRATEAFLNSTFREAFQAESKLLDCPKVTLTFPGRRGTTTRHKSVSTDHRIRQVFSEGEQKVVALADFLAEVSLRPRSAPIVFDDPVSSLDARRCDDVAARLVALSEDYQVIVFSHELYFVSKLISAFESSERRQRVSYYQVFVEDDKVGLVEHETNPRTDTVKVATGRIKAVLQDSRSSTGTERTEHIASAYGHLRTWIELLVEDELLKKAVKRHRANISVDRLRDVDGAAIDRVTETLRDIYDRASRRMWPHSHSLESLQVRPTLQELDADWAALQTLRDSL